jgi:hypothetical protein
MNFEIRPTKKVTLYSVVSKTSEGNIMVVDGLTKMQASLACKKINVVLKEAVKEAKAKQKKIYTAQPTKFKRVEE